MGGRSAPPRRPARVTRILLAAVVAAAVAAAVAIPASGAPPVITRQPPPAVAGTVGSNVTITAAVRGAATLQWQRAWSYRPDGWSDADGGAGASLTAPVRCPVYGFTLRYRLRACNADGCVTSAPSVWDGVTMPPPVWVATPPPVLPAGATGRWVAAAPTDAWLLVTPRLVGAPPGTVLPSIGTVAGLPARQAGVTVPASAIPPGARVVASATLICGGNHGISSATITSAPVTAAGPPPLTAACPAWVNPTAADAGGWVLTDGAAFTTPTCAACRAACARTPGCTTWVWGADAAVPARHRQCWLKARGDGAPAAPPPPPGGAPVPWVSGTLPAAAATACPGVWAADFDGRVLVAGDRHKKDDCTACAAACRARADCNVWVWGFAALSPRHRECWLKRWEGGGGPPTKAGSYKPDSPWLGGLLKDRL